MDDSTNKPKLQLVGMDGNAFLILGRASKAALRAGWSQEQVDKYLTEAQSGDYNNLLSVTMDYFEVD